MASNIKLLINLDELYLFPQFPISYLFHFVEIKFAFDLTHLVLAVSDYELEEEAREYVNSVHIEDDPVDKSPRARATIRSRN